ncbi:hypothetical protein SAMN02910357_00340 [Succinivibrio dextrinosolvens]|uniref:hypothetical protein n=1 Tax=Succinivibrio dextrinosolvens TaxID=83771 RepID=UPI0008DFB585|nr:hypothetical protein [Succinivibrio dextrinosolvens]SFS36391.1 hypothetical protein SAMN02910357_00340 [Succinivibrio dextrinosolvens]
MNKFSFRIKKITFSLLVCVFCFTFQLNSVFAENLEVKAVGKDENTAIVNAQVAAVRTVMNDMLQQDFVKSHVKELRGIIAKADNYSAKPVISSSNKKNNRVELIATVEVNKEALSEALRALGATIVKSYKDIYAERLNLTKQVFQKFFGNHGELLVKSIPAKLTDENEGKTESIVSDCNIFGPDNTDTFKPNSPIVVRYINSDKKNTRVYFALVKSSFPLETYEQTKSNTEQDSFYKDSADGLCEFITPLNQGNYEIRMFNDNAGACIARYSFKVRSEITPAFELERNIFAPDEEICLKVNGLDDFDCLNLMLVKAEDSEKRYKEIRDKRYNHSDDIYANEDGLVNVDYMNIKAPAEEGDYVLQLRPSGSRKYSSYNYLYSLPLASIPVTIKRPNVTDEYQLLTMPEYVSGVKVHAIIGKPENTERTKYLLKKEDSDKAILDRSVSSSVVLSNLYEEDALYETGEYKVELYEKEKDETPKFVSSFRVIPNPSDASIIPSLELYSNQIHLGGYIKFDFTASSNLNKSAFIGLVPKDTPKDPDSSFKAAKDRIFNLNHKRYGIEQVIDSSGLEAGKYELRMFDRNDEKGQLLTSSELEIKGEADVRQVEQEVLKDIEDLMSVHITLNPPRLISSSITIPDLSTKYDLNIQYEGESEPVYKLISEYSPEERVRLLPKVEFRKVANFKDACDIEIEKKIFEDARVSYTLGRDSSLESELKSFAQSVLTEWPVPGGLEKVQTAFKVGNDLREHGAAGLDALSEKKYGDAAKEASLFILKTLINTCGESECFLKAIGADKQKANVYFGSLSDAQFEEFLKRQAKIVQRNPNIGTLASRAPTLTEPLLNRLKYLKNVDMAQKYENILIGADKTLAVGSALKDAKPDPGTDSFITIDNGVIKTNTYGSAATAIAESLCRADAKCAAVVSTARLAYHTALDVRDFARDSAVIAAYTKWKMTRQSDADFEASTDEEKNIKDEYNRRIDVKTKVPLLVGGDALASQVRNIMAKTLHYNEETGAILNDNHRENARILRQTCAKFGYSSDNCIQLKFKENEFTDDEVEAYLEKQFKEWQKLEENNSLIFERTKEVQDIFKDIQDNNRQCALNFKKYYDANIKKRQKLQDISIFDIDKCKEEKELFEAFLDLQNKLENGYMSAIPPDGKICFLKEKNRRNKFAQQDFCDVMNIWGDSDKKLVEQKLMEAVSDRACNCGVSFSVVDGELYKAGNEPYTRMKEVSEKAKAKIALDEAGLKLKKEKLEKMENYTDDFRISVAMEHLNATHVLDCMCKQCTHCASTAGGGNGYDGGGRCRAYGVSGHTWPFPMPSGADVKRRCGYNDALRKHLLKETDDKKLDPMRKYKDVRKEIIKADEFLSLRPKNKCGK